jgi:protein-S-isoprenylcysteine O-methyltransferase Ste14
VNLVAVLIPLVIPALWIAWCVYWGWASRHVKSAQRTESAVSGSLHLVPLALAAVLLAVPQLPGWLGQRLLPNTWTVYATGVAAVAAGLGFTVWARIVLGRNWSGIVEIKREHEIVSSGPYHWVRHPIYTGLLLAFAGSAVARGEWRGVLAALIATAALVRKLRMEERWLTESFGSAYADYRARSWALLPFVY